MIKDFLQFLSRFFSYGLGAALLYIGAATLIAKQQWYGILIILVALFFLFLGTRKKR